MKRLRHVSLRPFTTFGVDASANHLVQLESMQDIDELPDRAFSPERDLVLGGGSNILFTSDVEGTVYLNRLKGRKIVEDDDDSVLIDIAAGESWHELVLWSLQQGYCGLENLSLIPGLAGAAPMQNIGAYGVELSDLLDSVQALDWPSGEILRISNHDCRFSYRDSRFKSEQPDRFLILSCRLRLQRNCKPNISYAGLSEELRAMNIPEPGPREVSDAVIQIRRRKLPNPEFIGNAGSFFKNPEIDTEQAEALRSAHDGIPIHAVSVNSIKLGAAWMIDQCGWKGYRDGDAGVSEQHALVLVNHGCARGMQILGLSRRISDSVYERFGIRLERETRVVGKLA